MSFLSEVATRVGRIRPFVHDVTIASGIASVVSLVLAYRHRIAVVPGLVFTVLSRVYSLIDEVFHGRRYLRGGADRIEMGSHVATFTGHGVVMPGGWWWFELGCPGVARTLKQLE